MGSKEIGTVQWEWPAFHTALRPLLKDLISRQSAGLGKNKVNKKILLKALDFQSFPPQVIQVAIKEKGGSLNLLAVIKFGGSGS